MGVLEPSSPEARMRLTFTAPPAGAMIVITSLAGVGVTPVRDTV
jgi:hypothetical protein